MMKKQHALQSIHIALVALLALSCSLSAQSRIKVEVEDPEFEDLQSPDFSGTNSKKWDKKDWLEMEVEFEVTLVDPKDAKFVDRLTVKWYVVAQNPERKGGSKYVLIEKEVEHINIPVGEAVVSSVYLSPSAIKRLSGSDRASERVITRAGGEILFNGQRVGAFSSDGDPGWWQSGSLSRYDRIPLRAKNETPFHYFWWDRYAENKVQR